MAVSGLLPLFTMVSRSIDCCLPAASKGHLVSMREGDAVTWVEFDDNGSHFADFREMWFEGNCAKCLSIAIFDDRRSMWVKMAPGDLTWSHDGATWHPIATGKWVPA